MNIIEFIKKTFDHNNLTKATDVINTTLMGLSVVLISVLVVSLGLHLAHDFITWTTPTINWSVAGRWFILSTTYPVLSYYWLRNKI